MNKCPYSTYTVNLQHSTHFSSSRSPNTAHTYNISFLTSLHIAIYCLTECSQFSTVYLSWKLLYLHANANSDLLSFDKE